MRELSQQIYFINNDVMSAADVWKLIFDSRQPWILSANGTIFKYDGKGVIPGLLKRWYAERKEMQAKLKEAINAGNKIEEEYWDKRQLVKKINLNSLYGAILNPGCRFFDKRIGQSTTLTGRSIAKHMDAYVNECITGKYDHVGETIIYGDTDSCYFSAWPVVKQEVEEGRMEWSKEIAIALYDGIADQVNASFPGFMEQAFHVPREMGAVIRGGREVVASKGLFITKKRYAVMIIDKEGKRVDTDGKPGKVKAMGLDLKRSDTPVVIQNFLSDILHDVLTGAGKDQVVVRFVLGEVACGLPYSVRGALEPAGIVGRLLGGQDLDEALREGVETVGARDVPVERRRVELREHVDPSDVGVQAIADRHVDESVFAPDGDRRFRTGCRERKETGALAATQDDGKCVVRHRAYVDIPRNLTLTSPVRHVRRAQLRSKGAR